MDSIVVTLLWLFALFMGVIAFIAQMQLFAIRRLLEQLVRQGGGDTSRADGELLEEWHATKDASIERELRSRGYHMG